MVMAGFAGNPHMIACTVLALTKLVHNHRGIITVVHCFIVSLHPVKLPACQSPLRIQPDARTCLLNMILVLQVPSCHLDSQELSVVAFIFVIISVAVSFSARNAFCTSRQDMNLIDMLVARR